MSCIQMFVSGAISFILMLIFEDFQPMQVGRASFSILYAGVLSSGIAYTLQMVGQKNAEPTVASLLMSLESVFSVISGAVVLAQLPSLRESAGCIIMFAAIIAAQVLDAYSPTELWDLAKKTLSKRRSA